MKNIFYSFIFLMLSSCAEKLLEQPENLIAKDKMVAILNDLAIINAAKNTNVMVLRKHDIEPMSFIYSKYNIDSLQFVESDRYYASIPELHEEIYIELTEKIEAEEKRLTDAKKVRDSLKKLESDTRRLKTKKTKDSLSKIADKKKK